MQNQPIRRNETGAPETQIMQNPRGEKRGETFPTRNPRLRRIEIRGARRGATQHQFSFPEIVKNRQITFHPRSRNTVFNNIFTIFRRFTN